MLRLETPPLELSCYRSSQNLKKDIRPGKLRVRVKIIMGKDEIRMFVGNIPTIVGIEIGGIQKFWFGKMIGEIDIHTEIDSRGTKGSRTEIFDNRNNQGFENRKGIDRVIVDSSVMADDIDDSDIEIDVLPDVGELTDEDEGDDNEVNTGEIIIKDVPWSLEFRSGDSFQPEPPTSSSVLATKSRKKAKTSVTMNKE
ncbi:hypothetical protein TNCV_935341 [Trichonephila clavipes]|nr:hypothetical protein TNCV_935341 [Trichonephila clavipes]